MKFELSQEVLAHEQDVKGVCAAGAGFVSVSRDGSVKLWERGAGWEPRVLFQSEQFVNCVGYSPEIGVVFGGQDQIARVVQLDGGAQAPELMLIGHEGNICAVDVGKDEIITGSWDSTAIVWHNNVPKHRLEHGAAVWDVRLLGNGHYLTCSADKTVKLWNNGQLLKTFIAHADVVRGICVVDDATFASVSNDSSIAITKFDGEVDTISSAHDTFIYRVIRLSTGELVTCGEDSTFRVWDLAQAKGHQLQQIGRVPCVTVWCACELANGDLVVGGSDNFIRVFTRDPARVASHETLLQYKESVQSTGISSNTIDPKSIKSEADLQKPGKPGEVIVVKVNGVDTAFQYSEQNKWEQVGQVIGGAGSADRKVEFENQRWDFVFDVDVQEGLPPLKLPYNVSENPYVAAERFLNRYELPSSYTDQIVEFITKNTTGVQLTGATTNPYADTRPKQKLLPQTEYLSFLKADIDGIVKGCEKFSPDAAKLPAVKQLLQAEDYAGLLSFAEEVIENWDNKLVGYDILRLIVHKLKQPFDKISEFIQIGLTSSGPTYFMTFRMLCNMFLSSWGSVFITDNVILSEVFDLTGIDATSKTASHTANAISTFVFNVSVYCVKNNNIGMAKQLGNLITSKCAELSLTSEANYRLLVAMGNLCCICNLKTEFARLHSGDEQRVVDLFEAVASL